MSIKSLVKKIAPTPIRRALRHTRHSLMSRQVSRARKAFYEASKQPEYLDYTSLLKLDKQYPVIVDNRLYDDAFIENLGNEYARSLMQSVPGNPRSHRSTLELGCGTGVVSLALQRMGKVATAIDLEGSRFDERAIKEGVDLYEMNAEELKFDDNSFDLVFSNATLEHITHPANAIKEAVRVVKPGGYVHVNFGPLYLAPFGLHAYTLTGIPYCHVLFSRQDLARLLKEREVEEEIDGVYVNKIRLESYRAIWNQERPSFSIVSYEEYLNYDHVNLIQSFPSCFRATSEQFEDFVVSSIAFILKKNA